MNKLFLTVTLIVLWLSSYCQKDNNMTGYSRAMVKESLQKYITENKFTNSPILESDTSLLLSIRDSALAPNDFYYHFTKSGKCDVEKKLSKCSDCLNSHLKDVLSDTKYEWQKVTDSLYLSKFSKKRMVEVVDDRVSCPYIKISKVKWSKKEYKSLLNKTS